MPGTLEAHEFLKVAADLTALVRDEKTAELLRRRAATACLPDTPSPAKPAGA